MKKTFLLLACVAFLFTANAQEGGFKQAAGDKALELNFAPLGGSPFSIAGIQFKSYSSETSAFRMNIFIGKTSESKILTQLVDTAKESEDHQLETKEKNSSLEIGLRPGIEKHFAGTDRLSPYIGAELDFAIKSSSKKEEAQYNGKDGDAPKVYTNKTKGEEGFMRIGANAVAGFDYFVAKKLYIGAEFGFGFSMNKQSKVKKENEWDYVKFGGQDYAVSVDDIDDYEQPLVEKGETSTMNIGPNVNGKIRVGFLF